MFCLWMSKPIGAYILCFLQKTRFDATMTRWQWLRSLLTITQAVLATFTKHLNAPRKAPRTREHKASATLFNVLGYHVIVVYWLGISHRQQQHCSHSYDKECLHNWQQQYQTKPKNQRCKLALWRNCLRYTKHNYRRQCILYTGPAEAK